MEVDPSLEPVLITGAAGFVGGYLIRYLHRHGVPVRGMVRDIPSAQELSRLGIELVEADLSKPETLEAAVKGCRSIMHIAAIFRKAGLPDSDYYAANTEGTRALLDLGIKHGVQRFIHCSTVGVHSHIENPPGDETTPYAPADIYQRSKMEGEKVALEYFRAGKIGGMVIRPAMIYGPGDLRTLKLFSAVARRRFFYVGPGSVHVHFIDVRDLVRAFVLALQRTEINGEVVIVAGKESLPMREAVDRIARLVGAPKPWLHLPTVPMQLLGDLCEAVCTPFRINPPLYRRRVDFFTKNRHFDGRKAERLLGFRPALSLEQELREIVDWYALHGYLPPHVGSSGVQSIDKNGQLASHPFNLDFEIPGPLENLINQESSSNKPVPMLLRHFDGTINFWNHGSEDVYGWNRYEAEGRISHHILQTKFPNGLESINASLSKERIWKGELKHIDRGGQSISVESTWQVIDVPDRQIVMETNVPLAV